jgi:hypothetical protein
VPGRKFSTTTSALRTRPVVPVGTIALTELARAIAVADALDLDDLRAEVGETAGCTRTCEDRRDIDHAQSL